MISSSDVIRELLKYKAFFIEDYAVTTIRNKLDRFWKYGYKESSLIRQKPIYKIINNYTNSPDCFIYDYSELLEIKVTKDNYLSFIFDIPCKVHNIKDLTMSQLRTILENDAKVANVVKKLEDQIQKFRDIDAMFADEE